MTTPPPFLLRRPRIHPSAFIAPNATLLGDVTVGEQASVWYSAVLRGDINRIVIGDRSNVQDGSVLHLSAEHGCIIGNDVTVGHMAMLHACTIGNEVLIGMGAIILDGVEIGDRCIIGAGALITQNKKIPPGSMVVGSPGKIVKTLTPEEQGGIAAWAARYVALIPHYTALGMGMGAGGASPDAQP
ncbi:MAG: gamma carbonic anhydrase family protein [Verrucomicrobiales bacterium]|nr:gamma carbonic anhydrase family protein [Verrucomicrobiales bacterium]